MPGIVKHTQRACNILTFDKGNFQRLGSSDWAGLKLEDRTL